MRVISLIISAVIVILATPSAFISTFYFVTNGDSQTDEFGALLIFVLFSISLSITAAASWFAARRRKVGYGVCLLNLVTAICAITAYILGFRSGSPDTRIWLLLATMLIANFALLWRLRSSAMDRPKMSD